MNRQVRLAKHAPIALTPKAVRRPPGSCEPTFAFYVDTEAERLAFVEWFLTALLTSDLFDAVLPFKACMAHFPGGPNALYFEDKYGHYETDERVIPLGTDANKLALFDLITTGELDTILGHRCMSGVAYRTVKTRAVMDTERATKCLEAKLPSELAEKIVREAVDVPQ